MELNQQIPMVETSPKDIQNLDFLTIFSTQHNTVNLLLNSYIQMTLKMRVA